MGLSDAFIILGTTVAYFDGVTVYYFTEYVFGWEAFVQQHQKLFSKVGSDSSIPWRVIPNNFSFPRSCFFRAGFEF